MNAVIFDLDGTLWDAMDPICSAWAAALERSALPHIALTREFLSGCMGKTPEEIGALAFPDAPRAEREAEMQKLYEYENELLCHCGGILYPRLPETLAAADDVFRSYGFHEAVFFCFVTLGPVPVVCREDDREQLPEFFVTHFVQILIFHAALQSITMLIRLIVACFVSMFPKIR